jgi:hypothetical protein
MTNHILCRCPKFLHFINLTCSRSNSPSLCKDIL